MLLIEVYALYQKLTHLDILLAGVRAHTFTLIHTPTLTPHTHSTHPHTAPTHTSIKNVQVLDIQRLLFAVTRLDKTSMLRVCAVRACGLVW